MRLFNSFRPSYILALLLCIPHARAAAQLRRDDHVRISSSGMMLADGSYLGQDSVSYLVQTGEKDTTRVLLIDARRIERFVATRPYGFKALLKGFLIGMGVGVGLAVTNHITHEGPDRGESDAIAAVLAAGITVVGTVVGAVIALVDHDVWEVVQ